MRTSADRTLGFTLGLALAGYALLTGGGSELTGNTWGEIILIAVGAAALVGVLAYGAAGRAWGGITFALFAALAALTAVSIAWSVQPDNSWIEANRTLSYLAAFGAALALARLAPERWPAIVGAIALAATTISACALLTKVFPAALYSTDPVGRISAPFGYWNASGLIAGLGLPACLWLGAQRERAPALRGLAVPAVSVLLTVLVMSYSRSAVIAAVVGLAFWFAVVPLRVRALAVLALGAVGAALISAWALSMHAFTHDLTTLGSRAEAGHGLGLVLVLVLVPITALGYAGVFALDRHPPTPRGRRAVRLGLVVLAALVPVAGVAVLASSSRGLTGEVSHIWSSLTSTSGGTNDAPGRLVTLGNSRPRYWREGITVADHALLKGVGAAGYGTARTRYTTDRLVAAHAHSYEIETFADFGLIGLAVTLGLFVAWALATARAVGFRRRGDPPAAGLRAERTGLLTLLAIVVMFGVHSSIDWTWFVPGTAVPALICAGWLAGRGPLEASVGRRPQPRSLIRSPAIGGAALAIATIALLAGWVVWQPLRSADADAAAVNAFAQGNVTTALADVRSSTARDPLAIQPLLDLSAIESALGRGAAARGALLKVTRMQPDNPQSWEALGDYELQRRQWSRAFAPLVTAHTLDLGSASISHSLAVAQGHLPG
jgi:hypothetical protein